MIRRLFLGAAALVLMSLSLQAQNTDTLRYHVSLKDKVGSAYSLSKPEKFLSQRALDRRARQNIKVDSTDLPVSEAYVKQIEKLGVKVVVKGKWENFVTVSTNDPLMAERIKTFDFVKEVHKVWQKPSGETPASEAKRDSLVNKQVYHPDSLYGASTAQIQISNAQKLHEAGFKGQNMIIGIIDAGFHNADRMDALNNVRILGYKDLTGQNTDVFAESSHGLAVLSCIGANKPGYIVGTAPEASFYLLRSEDSYSEQPIEEDYWCAAAEYADSVGVDVVNTSLGYNAFDDPADNYELRHLDGKTILMSRQAARFASKGMVLVCSAGNSGRDSWKKVTTPGDADHVLTVGAIDSTGLLATFSSIGTSADGRIKPDVVAVGVASSVLNTRGNQSRGNGTSFASPIMCGMVACLWQACPSLSVDELLDLIRKSGDRADYPDNIYGYGVPDMWKAYQTYKQAH